MTWDQAIGWITALALLAFTVKIWMDLIDVIVARSEMKKAMKRGGTMKMVPVEDDDDEPEAYV